LKLEYVPDLMDESLLTCCQKLLEVAQGLAYLHSQKIIHGDLRGVSDSFPLVVSSEELWLNLNV